MIDSWRQRMSTAVVAGVVVAASAMATTVIAKSFRDLAVEADGVFAGAVTEVRSYRNADGRIRTAVRFGELRWLVAPASGQAPAGDEKELTFAGGRVGEVAEVVGGMPHFTVGQRVVIFYRDGVSVSPIVGFHQGCYGLRETAGGDTVLTADRRPVIDVEGGELVTGDQEQAGMSLDEFAAAVSRLRDAGAE